MQVNTWEFVNFSTSAMMDPQLHVSVEGTSINESGTDLKVGSTATGGEVEWKNMLRNGEILDRKSHLIFLS